MDVHYRNATLKLALKATTASDPPSTVNQKTLSQAPERRESEAPEISSWRPASRKTGVENTNIWIALNEEVSSIDLFGPKAGTASCDQNRGEQANPNFHHTHANRMTQSPVTPVTAFLPRL
jgi:hypothetical protein